MITYSLDVDNEMAQEQDIPAAAMMIVFLFVLKRHWKGHDLSTFTILSEHDPYQDCRYRWLYSTVNPVYFYWQCMTSTVYVCVCVCVYVYVCLYVL